MSEMKPSSGNQPDQRLSELLKEWEVSASPAPRFQERVWQRIARAEAPSTSGWGAIWARWQAALTRPSVAASYLTLLLVLGFSIGWSRGLQTSARMDQVLSA